MPRASSTFSPFRSPSVPKPRPKAAIINSSAQGHGTPGPFLARSEKTEEHNNETRTTNIWALEMTERKDDRLWGGRFEREPNAHFDAFQRSFAFDRRLLPYEIAVDRAWAKALEPIGIFTATEVKQTLAALDKISEHARTDPPWVDSFGAGAEDVHHFVEKALVEELGPLGWKLHTGRSRNELVATDFRLFVIDASAKVQRRLEALLNAFLLQAKASIGVPMAGMTHMQHAQP